MEVQNRAPAWDISFDDSKSQNAKLPQSFTSALRDKYCSSDNYEHESDFVVKITITGKPKNISQTELGYLRNVSLCEQNITKAELPPKGLTGLCPNLTELDLSWNKLESWDEILPILHQLKFLTHFNIAHNNLQNANSQLVLDSCKKPIPQIKDLNLSSTNVSWDDVEKLAKLVPNLQELHLCLNGYANIQISGQYFQNLECLRLNKNKIKSWDEIWKLHMLPKLKTLILARNLIDKVVYGKSESWKACEEIVEELATACSLVTEKGDGDFADFQDSVCKEVLEDIVNDVEITEMGDGDCMVHCQDSDKICKEVLDDIVKEVETKVNKTEPNTGGVNPAELEDLSGHEGISEKIDEKDNTGIQDCAPNKDPQEVRGTPDVERDHVKNGSQVPPFPQLELINLSETQLSKWGDLKELSKFPKLCKVRIQKTNFLKNKSIEERRKFLVACLPKAEVVNGSEVSCDERDKSERHFLRYFVNEKKKPARYHELEKKHGKLEPLKTYNLMLDYIEWPEVKIKYEGAVVFSGPIHAKDNVGSLRKLIAKKTNLHPMHFRLYHHSIGGDSSLDELNCDNLPISRYNVKDGDEIMVDKKTFQHPRNVWKHSNFIPSHR